MLPAEIFDTRKRLVALSRAKPREKAEAILKAYMLFIYGNICYVTNSFCTVVLNPLIVCELHLLNKNFLLLLLLRIYRV